MLYDDTNERKYVGERGGGFLDTLALGVKVL